MAIGAPNFGRRGWLLTPMPNAKNPRHALGLAAKYGSVRATELPSLADQIVAGRRAELPWESFRLERLPGWSHADAAAQIDRWAKRYGIAVGFEERNVRLGDQVTQTIVVTFGPA